MNLLKIFAAKITKSYWKKNFVASNRKIVCFLIGEECFEKFNDIKKSTTILHAFISGYELDGFPEDVISFRNENKSLLFKLAKGLLRSTNIKKSVAAGSYLFSYENYFKKGVHNNYSLYLVSKRMRGEKSFDSLGKCYSFVSEDFKKVKKRHKVLFKRFMRDDFFGKIEKIDFSLGSVVTFSSFLILIFGFSGFLYNKILLSHFGVNVSYFYEVGDYISSSVDKLYVIGGNAFFGLFVFMLGIQNSLFTMHEEYHYEKEIIKSNLRIPILAVSFLLFVLIPVFYFDLEIKYKTLFTILFVVSLVGFKESEVERYFNNVFFARFVYLITASFLCGILGHTYDEIELAEKCKIKSNVIDFKYVGETDFNTAESCFLTANSKYVFFYNKDVNSVTAFEKGSFPHFEMKK